MLLLREEDDRRDEDALLGLDERDLALDCDFDFDLLSFLLRLEARRFLEMATVGSASRGALEDEDTSPPDEVGGR